MASGTVITVGICPCWDITCRIDGIEWDEHKKIDSQTIAPAGKALNISKALAWLGVKSVAAGLWGKSDYPQMAEAIAPLGEFISPAFTITKGRTRQNVTVVDTRSGREMHLRAQSKLADRQSLQRLSGELERIVDSDSTVVFAGAMPAGKLLKDCVSVIKECKNRGRGVVIDTSANALKKIIDLGGIDIVKPNLQELCELLGREIEDDPLALAQAGRKLCRAVGAILISRGSQGAVVVARDMALQARVTGESVKASGTVGCGDYLLAGFLAALREKQDMSFALSKAVKVAAARAWAWADSRSWADVDKQIEVEIAEIA
jgi:1-phosphofructokinase family hexose kinase